MSMTFFFNGDEMITEREECICVHEGQPNTVCGYCNGNGYVHFVRAKHEFTFSNMNAHSVLAYLGLQPDHCGSLPVTPDFLHKVYSSAMDALMASNFDMFDRLTRLYRLGRAAKNQGATEVLYG